MNSNKEVLQVHSEINRGQCEFLQKLISANHFKSSIEIGFAFGISTLAIVEEVSKNGGNHTVIDKFEVTGWGGAGLDLIAQAGYASSIKFYEEYCYIVLPELLASDKKFDFAFIDSTKQMDWLLVDFFFLDKILMPGGIIAFDDVSVPGIRKLLRYISQFPNYKIYDTYPENIRLNTKHRMMSALRYLPFSERYIKEDVIKTDFDMGINAHCVALQKIDDDKRKWDWHVDF